MTTELNQPYLISLNIAGFTITLATEDKGLYQRLSQHYADFIDDSEKSLVTIDLRIVPDAVFIEVTPGLWQIESTYSADELTYRSFLEQGVVNWRTGRGHLDMHQDTSIENFLRVIYAWLCLQDGGLLLHAAGIIRNGKGYVFFGPSGAGKTTTTRLSADSSEILSDDLVILRPNNGSCTLYGVPFKGEWSDAPRANQQVKLSSIFRLKQDSEHYLEPLPHTTAVAELAAASPFIVGDLTLSHQLLEVCRQITQTVPVQMMHFKKDDGFWKVIDGLDKSVPDAAPANGRPGH